MTDSGRIKERLEESFGVVVFRSGLDGDDVLVVRTDHWGFPKGHAEGLEDGLAAALREVKEETDITSVVKDAEVREVETYRIDRQGFSVQKTVTYFLGTGDGSPVPQAGEIREARWVPIGEVMDLLSHESTREILRVLYKRYTGATTRLST